MYTSWQTRRVTPQSPFGLCSQRGRSTISENILEKESRVEEEKPVLIFGASSDKDTRKIILELSHVVSEVFTTHSDHPRAVDCNILAEEISFLPNQVLPVRSIPNLLERIKSYLDEGQDIVCCGSIYLVGHLRPLLIELIEKHIHTDI